MGRALRQLGMGILAFCALHGCAEPTAQPAPELQLIEPELDCGISRRHDAPTSVVITVENSGDGLLEVFEVIPPAGVIAMDISLSVPPGGSETITFECPTDQARIITGDVTIRTNEQLRSEVFLPAVGEVTPYIRVSPEPLPALDTALELMMSRDNLIGLGVAVVRGQDMIYMRGLGFEDREAAIPVDPEVTLFRWASVSKGIAGLASVIALRDNVVDLDSDIQAFYEDFTPPTHFLPRRCEQMSCAVELSTEERVLSLRQLLSHTAGVQHYTNGLADPVPPTELTANPEHNRGFAWALEYWIDSPLIAKPGTAFSYSTFGSNLAGAALEAAVGVSFADYVDEHIAQVVGMETLRPDYHWEQSPRRAVGYYRVGAVIRRDSDTDVSWKLPGGGFRSTVADLGRYCGALMDDVLIPDDLREGELWAPVPPASGYALGFGVSDTFVEHGGAQEKTRTYLRMRRNEDLCVVLMTNSTYVDPEALSLEIDAALGL